VIRATLLAASVVANLVLSGLLLSAPSERHATSPAALPAPRMPQRIPAASVNPAGYYHRLLTLGLDAHEAKLLLVAQLEAAATNDIAKPQLRYWEPGPVPGASFRLAVALAERSVRTSLESVFGRGETAAAKEFARLYRPLAPELGFLSSAQQIAVSEWRLRQLAMSDPPEPDRHTVSATNAACARAAPAWPALPPPMLTAAERFEYTLRWSALAAALRTSGAMLSESEFRRAFQWLSSLDREPGNLTRQLEVRRQLRSALGTRRYELIWRQRDPTFRVLARLAPKLELDDATLDSAYGVMNDSQERLLALAAAEPAGDVDRRALGTRAVNADERQRLEALIGAEAADTLISARAAEFFALSRSVGTDSGAARQ
jgi:hypothetical protein